MDTTATIAHTDQRLEALPRAAGEIVGAAGLDAVARWGLYLAEAREAINRFRGQEIADEIYLRGVTLRELVDRLTDNGQSVTHQAVSDWLNRHGPDSYITVARDGDTYTLARIKIETILQTRRDLRTMLDAGRRVAPTRWEIADDDDAQQVWERLEPANG
jgi:hypothetical protein